MTNQDYINFIANCLASLGINGNFKLVVPSNYSYFTSTPVGEVIQLEFASKRDDFLYRLRGGPELLRRWSIRWEEDNGVSLFSLDLYEFIKQ